MVQHRYGVVLAGGEGRRVASLVRRLRGDALPKQYVAFVGTRSMLEHTWDRTERLLARSQVLTIISQDHLTHPQVRWQLNGRHQGTVIVQPENLDTGPGVLLPLAYVRHSDPDAVVVIAPSDHCIIEEDLFMDYVDLAFRIVEQNASRLILLGVEPKGPETEYGYLVPGPESETTEAAPARPRIARFVEKPPRHVAEPLIHEGALWNTMVMVCHVRTLFSWVERVAPDLHAAFATISDAIGTPCEDATVQDVYQHLAPTNFSRHIVEPLASRHEAPLIALPLQGIAWSDWGSEDRIMEMAAQLGRLGRQAYGIAQRNTPGTYTLMAKDGVDGNT